MPIWVVEELRKSGKPYKRRRFVSAWKDAYYLFWSEASAARTCRRMKRNDKDQDYRVVAFEETQP